MKNHTGNFHKQPNNYPYQKPAPAKCSFDPHSNRDDRGYHDLPNKYPNVSSQLPFSVEPGCRSHPQSKLRYGLVRSHRLVLISTYTQRHCKDLTARERRNLLICVENQLSTISMRRHQLETLLRTSSSEVAPQTSKSDLKGSMTMPRNSIIH